MTLTPRRILIDRGRTEADVSGARVLGDVTEEAREQVTRQALPVDEITVWCDGWRVVGRGRRTNGEKKASAAVLQRIERDAREFEIVSRELADLGWDRQRARELRAESAEWRAAHPDASIDEAPAHLRAYLRRLQIIEQRREAAAEARELVEQGKTRAPASLPAEARAAVQEQIDRTLEARALTTIAYEEGPAGMLWGAPSTVYYPHGGRIRTLAVRYALIPRDQVVASHDPKTFDEDPRFPGAYQERDYTRPEEREKVNRQVSNFAPPFVLWPAPDALNGPPVVARHGDAWIVVGGNSRAMTIARVCEQQGAEVYEGPLREWLELHPSFQGLAGAPVAGMMLCRVALDALSPSISADLNAGFTQRLGAGAAAVSGGVRLPERFVRQLGDLAEQMTIREALERLGAAAVQELEGAGIISAATAPELVDRRLGGLTSFGRDLVVAMLVGRVVGDKTAMARLPARVQALLERVAALVVGQPDKIDSGVFGAACRAVSELPSLDPEMIQREARQVSLGAGSTLDGWREVRGGAAAWAVWIVRTCPTPQRGAAALLAWVRAYDQSAQPLFGLPAASATDYAAQPPLEGFDRKGAADGWTIGEILAGARTAPAPDLVPVVDPPPVVEAPEVKPAPVVEAAPEVAEVAAPVSSPEVAAPEVEQAPEVAAPPPAVAAPRLLGGLNVSFAPQADELAGPAENYPGLTQRQVFDRWFWSPDHAPDRTVARFHFEAGHQVALDIGAHRAKRITAKEAFALVPEHQRPPKSKKPTAIRNTRTFRAGFRAGFYFLTSQTETLPPTIENLVAQYLNLKHAPIPQLPLMKFDVETDIYGKTWVDLWVKLEFPLTQWPGEWERWVTTYPAEKQPREWKPLRSSGRVFVDRPVHVVFSLFDPREVTGDARPKRTVQMFVDEQGYTNGAVSGSAGLSDWDVKQTNHRASFDELETEMPGVIESISLPPPPQEEEPDEPLTAPAAEERSEGEDVAPLAEPPPMRRPPPQVEPPWKTSIGGIRRPMEPATSVESPPVVPAPETKLSKTSTNARLDSWNDTLRDRMKALGVPVPADPAVDKNGILLLGANDDLAEIIVDKNGDGWMREGVFKLPGKPWQRAGQNLPKLEEWGQVIPRTVDHRWLPFGTLVLWVTTYIRGWAKLKPTYGQVQRFAPPVGASRYPSWVRLSWKDQGENGFIVDTGDGDFTLAEILSTPSDEHSERATNPAKNDEFRTALYHLALVNWKRLEQWRDLLQDADRSARNDAEIFFAGLGMPGTVKHPWKADQLIRQAEQKARTWAQKVNATWPPEPELVQSVLAEALEREVSPRLDNPPGVAHSLWGAVDWRELSAGGWVLTQAGAVLAAAKPGEPVIWRNVETGRTGTEADVLAGTAHPDVRAAIEWARVQAGHLPGGLPRELAPARLSASEVAAVRDAAVARDDVGAVSYIDAQIPTARARGRRPNARQWSPVVERAGSIEWAPGATMTRAGIRCAPCTLTTSPAPVELERVATVAIEGRRGARTLEIYRHPEAPLVELREGGQVVARCTPTDRAWCGAGDLPILESAILAGEVSEADALEAEADALDVHTIGQLPPWARGPEWLGTPAMRRRALAQVAETGSPAARRYAVVLHTGAPPVVEVE